MSDIKFGDSNKNALNATSRGNTKTSKPFCSLAYLAKSTIAINGTNDIRTINGHNSCSNGKNTNNNDSPTSHTNLNNGNNCQPSTPNVAATAKVNERGSPSLPTGASTTVNGTQNETSNSNTCPDYKHNTNGRSSVTDVFGIINEEDMESCCDQVDGELNNDLRRPWELANGSYVKRVPPSLMTNGSHLNGLPSLSKLNSLDCWDYTIELECLQGPQGNQTL